MGRRIKIENREAILRAAYTLFLAKGYQNVSIIEIGASAGINPRIIFRHFSKKEDILGSLIENIEKEMIGYIKPVATDDSLLNYCVYVIMKCEFSLLHADYFRLVSSLIKLPEALMRESAVILSMIFPPDRDWRYDKATRIKWFYMLGGTQMLQYEFVTNFSGYSLSTANSDFMRNYNKTSLSGQALLDFRDYMNYAMRQNIRALGELTENEENSIIDKAKAYLGSLDINGFRSYYESRLGYYSRMGDG